MALPASVSALTNARKPGVSASIFPEVKESTGKRANSGILRVRDLLVFVAQSTTSHRGKRYVGFLFSASGAFTPQNTKMTPFKCTMCLRRRSHMYTPPSASSNTAPLACGLVRHFAPCAQPARVPYGHGDLAGAPFAYRTGSMAQVYLVAPALRFIEHDHGPLTTYDETQQHAYYRSIPDMQHPAPVFGSTPLGQRLGSAQPPTPPRCRVPSPKVETTPDRDEPPTPRTSRSDDASLLRQYHRIARIVSSRRAVNPTRGRSSTARCI